jgi:hypothetical protein
LLTRKGLADVITTVYILTHFAIERPGAPSTDFARRLISLRWKDAASDGHVYHLQTLLDRLVPGMSQKDRVELIRICHSELVRHPELAGGGRTKQNTPASLQPYVQW